VFRRVSAVLTNYESRVVSNFVNRILARVRGCDRDGRVRYVVFLRCSSRLCGALDRGVWSVETARREPIMKTQRSSVRPSRGTRRHAYKLVSALDDRSNLNDYY
jgi:hypothetical protein